MRDICGSRFGTRIGIRLGILWWMFSCEHEAQIRGRDLHGVEQGGSFLRFDAAVQHQFANRRTRVEGCRMFGGRLLEKREKWPTPSYFGQYSETNPRSTFPLKWPTRLFHNIAIIAQAF